MNQSLAGFSTALLAAPGAFLERGRGLARRARTSSVPPSPLARQTNVFNPMKLTRTDTASECRLHIEGALDVHTAPELKAVFESVLASQPLRVVLDLEHLTMMDSSGVGAIVSLFKRVNADGGTIVVTGVHSQPLAVCKLLKLERVFGL